MNNRERDKARAQWQAWYNRNREKLNAQRRERYRKDPDYREKQIERAREHRTSSSQTATEPKTRYIDDMPVTTYRISAAAHAVGRYPKRLVEWEKRGWIPKHTLPYSQRMYTSRQVMLIKRIAEALEYRGTMKEKKENLERVVEQVRSEW